MQKPSPVSTSSWFRVLIVVPSKLLNTKLIANRSFPFKNRFPSFIKPPDHHNHHHHDCHGTKTSSSDHQPVAISPLSISHDDHDYYDSGTGPVLVPVQPHVARPRIDSSALPDNESSETSFQPENGSSDVSSFTSALEITQELPSLVSISSSSDESPCPNQHNKPKPRCLKIKPNRKKHPSFKFRISPRKTCLKNPNVVAAIDHHCAVVPNPIIEVFREEQLGRNILVLAIPIATGFMAYYNPRSASLPGCLAAVALSLGSAAIWNGILLRNVWPRAANASELFGVALVLVAFFGYLGSRLPEGYLWLPAVCLVICLVPLAVALSSACSCREINGGQDHDHHDGMRLV